MADRPRQRQERQTRDRAERDDRRSERAVGDRRIVGDRGDPQRVEIGDPERDQDRRDHRPGIAKPDQAFEQGPKGPSKQDSLHPDILRALRQEPAAKAIEHAAHHQCVEQHDPPEGDPVDVPRASRRTVEIGEDAVTWRHAPDENPQQKGHDRADQGGRPCRHPQNGKQDQQSDDGDQGDEPGHGQIAQRVYGLGEHREPPFQRRALSNASAKTSGRAFASAVAEQIKLRKQKVQTE